MRSPTASTSISVTPAMAPAAASTSRGTAMSTMPSGRCERSCWKAATSAAVSAGALLLVVQMTTSTWSATVSGSVTAIALPARVDARATAEAPLREITMSRAPASWSRRAASALIVPAPTRRMPRPSRSPVISRAIVTAASAMLPARRPTARSGRDVVEARVEAARLARDLVRVPELAEHLCLTDHHALEPSRHPEHVPDRLRVANGDEMVADRAVVGWVEVEREARDDPVGKLGGRAADVELRAVARRQHGGAAQAAMTDQVAEKLMGLRLGHHGALSHRYGRAVETEPGGVDVHRGLPAIRAAARRRRASWSGRIDRPSIWKPPCGRPGGDGRRRRRALRSRHVQDPGLTSAGPISQSPGDGEGPAASPEQSGGGRPRYGRRRGLVPVGDSFVPRLGPSGVEPFATIDDDAADADGPPLDRPRTPTQIR